MEEEGEDEDRDKGRGEEEEPENLFALVLDDTEDNGNNDGALEAGGPRGEDDVTGEQGGDIFAFPQEE